MLHLERQTEHWPSSHIALLLLSTASKLTKRKETDKTKQSTTVVKRQVEPIQSLEPNNSEQSLLVHNHGQEEEASEELKPNRLKDSLKTN